jgi:putative two-component system response regulator
VLERHERFDGSGYPLALRGDQLRLETRILAVCDVYDALVSKRVYRAAWSPAQAFSLLKAKSGHEFDARCVEALAEVLGEETGERHPAVAADAAPSGYDRAPVTV